MLKNEIFWIAIFAFFEFFFISRFFYFLKKYEEKKTHSPPSDAVQNEDYDLSSK